MGVQRSSGLKYYDIHKIFMLVETLSVAQTIATIEPMVMNDEFDGMWKETTMA
jgi:hypothetical protein